MRFVGIHIAIAVFFLAGYASPADCANNLYNACINADNWWPDSSLGPFVHVSGTELTPAGQAAAGMHTDYQYRPVVASLATPSGIYSDAQQQTHFAGTDVAAINHQVTFSPFFAYSWTKTLEWNVVLPLSVSTGGGAGVLTGSPTHTVALRDVRWGVALDGRQLLLPKLPPEWGFGLRLTMSVPTGDRGMFASDRTAVFAPLFVGSYHGRRWLLGAELGARVRGVNEFSGVRIGTQAVAAIAVGYTVLQRWSLGLEAFALPTFVEQHELVFGGRGLVSAPSRSTGLLSAEWMLSSEWTATRDGTLRLRAGFGTGLTGAFTTPLIRGTLSVVLAPPPPPKLLNRSVPEPPAPNRESHP